MRGKYTASLGNGKTYLTIDELDLARRRTLPFLLAGSHLSLEHLMIEAWLQGVRDAMEVLHP